MTAQPIATAPRDGQVIFVGDESGNIAKVFWHEPAGGALGCWCYGHAEAPDQPWHQVDFEPTRWSNKPGAFLEPAQVLTSPAT